MVYPVIPEHKKAIIAVEQGRYMVSRYLERAPYRFEVQPAANWEDLEPLAVAAVESEVGAAAADHYPCPDALAALAVWPETEA